MTDQPSATDRFIYGYSCSQSILTAYCEHYGIDHLTGVKIAAGFGAGMQKAKTCGAVTGAIMVLGLHFGDETSVKSAGRRPVYTAVQEFIRQFEDRHETVSCGGLLGCDVNTREGMKIAAENDLFKTQCPKFVESAVVILDSLLAGTSPGAGASGNTGGFPQAD